MRLFFPNKSNTTTYPNKSNTTTYPNKSNTPIPNKLNTLIFTNIPDTETLQSSHIIINDTSKKVKDDIYLIYQYYLPKTQRRIKEVQEALSRNINNNHISKIYILSERHYTDEEFGLKNPTDKIIQIVTGVRMIFKDIFTCVERYNLKGYIISSNSDIFFDDSISKLHYTDLDVTRKLISLFRWEYTGEKNLINCKLHIRPHSHKSQDSWIFHSNFNLNIPPNDTVFNIHFGHPGCDNRVLHVFKKYGFLINNDPIMFKSYHCHHDDKTRTQYHLPRIPPPHVYIIPEIY